MTDRERFLRTMRYEPVDRRPFHAVSVWPDTLARWRGEGLPPGVDDVHAHLGVACLQMRNVSGHMGPYPAFEQRTLHETETEIIRIDDYGRTVREFKDHTSMPEWEDFPVKTPEDLERVLAERYDAGNLDARFTPAWEAQARDAATSGALVLIDGGCFYWTLRSLAGVENASYLLYDAPELVEELFERYCVIALEGIRRAGRLTPIDTLGFGEDIACKNGPFMSLEMFRAMVVPRYRRTVDLAAAHGVEQTWYDSDGDLRALLPDYLSVGIHTLAPCEVAAGTDPAPLRKQYGRALRFIGGVDKRAVAKGPDAIRAELDRLRPVVREGGFIPAIDHSVAADISWDNYRYYVDEMRQLLRETS